MRTLRASLLLGIVAANVTAFSALAVVIVRDGDRRDRAEWAARSEVRDDFVELVAGIFVAFLREIDFDEFDSTAPAGGGFMKRVLALEPWAYVRDAYLTDKPYRHGELVVPGKIELNPIGAPDPESEAIRGDALRLMATAFEEGLPQRSGDVVVIPLFEGGVQSDLARLRRAAEEIAQSAYNVLDGTRRELLDADLLKLSFAADQVTAQIGEAARVDPTRRPWGAVYLRVNVPPGRAVDSSLDVPIVALALGGATLVAVASLWLLLRRLVIAPLEQVSDAAVAVAGGALATRLEPTGDSIEIDAFIANFNRMTAELAESRGALERRVEEALAKVQQSEKRLAVNERLAAMGTLAAGIAHEINNPLGGMLNAVSTLKRRAEREDQKRYLSLVEDGLSRIREVVERMLRYSPSRTKRGVFSLVTIVEDAARFVRHKLHERGVTLETEVGADLRIDGEPSALGQVFLNLFLNAIDAMEGTGKIKSIRAVAVRDGEHAVVTVQDTGKGMNEEQRVHAFDLFFTTKATGTGIGLAIVHQIVSQHGGAISLKSEPGVGTEFEIRLPLAKEDA